jgi:Fur family transcriptional regulator, ferric uptake regulator
MEVRGSPGGEVRCRLKVMAQGPDPVSAEEATTLLRAAGQRVTQPRVAVLACILAADAEHLSADALLEHVAGAEPPIHRATVYRTLEGLTSAGVLRHVHLDRGLTAYHLADSVSAPSARGRAEHLHAQCTSCGQITDLPVSVLGDIAVRIRRATGFRLDASHVAFSGLCRSCALGSEG